MGQGGFGLVYLEAMNYAKPCVGCFGDGGEDVIVDGETGLLVHDPNDAQELQQVLIELLEDPARIDAVLDEAKALAATGKPVVINVHIAKNEFRKGSISM